MSLRSAGRRAGDESGQVFVLLAVGLVLVLLGMAALVVDLGQARVAKHQLQSTADAAALAAAAQLPNASAASAAALSYGAGGKNPVALLDDAQTTSDPHCLRSTPGCTQPNAVTVTVQGAMPTNFARVLGIGSMDISATATASRSVTTSPLDVVLVLDRTGSMSGQMRNLVDGVKAFLGVLDPSLVRVGLVVLPPAPASGRYCDSRNPPRCDYYPLGDGGYLVDPLGSSLAKIGADVAALTSAGSTAYKQALIAAQNELDLHGRPGVKHVIVFETDGAANTVPDSYYSQLEWLTVGSERIRRGVIGAGHEDDVRKPCQSAVDYARSLNGKTTVYTVGFHLSSDQTCYQAPNLGLDGGDDIGYRDRREWGITAADAVADIATDTGGLSFLQENGSGLADTFAQVATQLSGVHLVPDDS